MQPYSPFVRRNGRPWIDQILSAKTVQNNGVVRRNLADIEREIGIPALELEVRKRGYHMLRSVDHMVIFCTSEPLHVIC